MNDDGGVDRIILKFTRRGRQNFSICKASHNSKEMITAIITVPTPDGLMSLVGTVNVFEVRRIWRGMLLSEEEKWNSRLSHIQATDLYEQPWP